MPHCLFCKIASGQIPSKQAYSDERVYAFHDVAPKAPTHILVIPRKHIGKLADASAEDEGLLGEVVSRAAAIARGLGLDVSIVRLAFLLLCLAGGVGVVVYGGLWLVLPSSPEACVGSGRHRIDDLGASVVVVGVILVLRAGGIWFSDGVALVGAVIAVGAVLVWGGPRVPTPCCATAARRRESPSVWPSW